jgi:hypothetical protein
MPRVEADKSFEGREVLMEYFGGGTCARCVVGLRTISGPV